MEDKSVRKGMKRLLQQSAAERSGSDPLISKRFLEQVVLHSHIIETSNEPQNVDAFEHNENEVRGDYQHTVAPLSKDAEIGRKRTSRRMKTLLEQFSAENCAIGETIEQGRTDDNLFHSDIVEGSSQRDDQFRNGELLKVVTEDGQVAPKSVMRRMKKLLFKSSDKNYKLGETIEQGRCSQSFGQALYQRSRQGYFSQSFYLLCLKNNNNHVNYLTKTNFLTAGLVVTYEDSGDNIYTYDFCNVRFWSGEAIKRSSSNAPLIYTNCCQKGQIKVQESKSAPTFLENLLNPDNGTESKLFRENRVYNSMFCFTSMGATIDHEINIGSGPYVFKISGQVHH